MAFPVYLILLKMSKFSHYEIEVEHKKYQMLSISK